MGHLIAEIIQIEEVSHCHFLNIIGRVGVQWMSSFSWLAKGLFKCFFVIVCTLAVFPHCGAAFS